MSDRIQITSPFSKLVYEGEAGDTVFYRWEHLPVKTVLSILPKVPSFKLYVFVLERTGAWVRGNKSEMDRLLRQYPPDRLVVCHLRISIDPEDRTILDEELTIGES